MSRSLSFGTTLIRTFADLWIHTRSQTVSRLVFLTFFWGALIIAASGIMQLLDQTNQGRPVLQIATLVFFGLLTVTWVAVATKQTILEFANRQPPRELAAGMLALLPTLTIAGLLVWGVTSLTLVVLQQPFHPLITDFTRCEQAGGVILQTSPRQCVTTQATFVEK